MSALLRRELLALDALEQRPEVARAEALVALALDDLEEEGPRVGAAIQARRVFQEDLQEVGPARLPIHQDAELLELADVLVDALHALALQALRQALIIG